MTTNGKMRILYTVKNDTTIPKESMKKTWTIFYKVKFSKFDKFDGKFSSNTVHTTTVEADTKRDAVRKFEASNLHTVRGLPTKKGKTVSHKVRTHVSIVKVFTGDPTPKNATVLPSRKPRWMR